MTGRHVASRRAGLTLNAYIGPVVAGNVVTDNSVRHLKHNSWPTPHPSVIGVELLGGSRQPMAGRLATHPSNTTVKIRYDELAKLPSIEDKIEVRATTLSSLLNAYLDPWP